MAKYGASGGPKYMKKGAKPKDSQKKVSLGGKVTLPGNEAYNPPEKGYTGANVVGSKVKTWC